MRKFFFRILVFVTAFVLAMWCYFLLNREAVDPLIPHAEDLTPERESVHAVTGGITVLSDTPFEREYGREGGSQKADLRILDETLFAARILVKDHYRIPFADNQDFTAFLTGKNGHRVAWIRPDHPSINRHGEITDRQGNPLFFHQESSSYTTLRSAGKDGIMWNEDDITFDRARPEL